MLSDDRRGIVTGNIYDLAPDLTSLGWTTRLDKWADRNGAELRGRVARTHRGTCVVFVGDQKAVTATSGSIRSRTGLAPATGDFVAIRSDEENDGEYIISAIADRKTALVRRAPGRVPEPQVLAANIDDVFVMQGMDRPVNFPRLERLLVIAWDSGAEPVVLLTKADQVADPDGAVRAIQVIAPGVKCLAISTHSGRNIEEVEKRIRGNRTVALIGLSGIGKSTLVNTLSGGEVQRTGQVRAVDRRGRHTTVTRDLIPLPGGGIVVDTPGIREIALWNARTGLAKAFPLITHAAQMCKFTDCTHHREPDCAVRRLVSDRQISRRRVEHYLKLTAELDVQDEQLLEFERRSESRARVNAEERSERGVQRHGQRSSSKKGSNRQKSGRRRKGR
ncbi:MAG: ribosome small subunit-dependent GTPase A [Acidimicrobiales bacterium]|nr:ribosome small subunit-dependent GTPase A [Acidimicrobiales bacterium]